MIYPKLPYGFEFVLAYTVHPYEKVVIGKKDEYFIEVKWDGISKEFNTFSIYHSA